MILRALRELALAAALVIVLVSWFVDRKILHHAILAARGQTAQADVAAIDQ
jgi:hypothetical protein